MTAAEYRAAIKALGYRAEHAYHFRSQDHSIALYLPPPVGEARLWGDTEVEAWALAYQYALDRHWATALDL